MFKRIWGEARRGENIDLYATIVIAVIFVVLDLLGLAPDSWLNPLTLAVLAMVSMAILMSRYHVEDAVQRLRMPAISLFQDKFPEEFELDLLQSESVYIIGASLSRTVKTYYETLQTKLKRGHHVRILILDPNGPAAELTEMRTNGHTHKDPERLRLHLRSTLADLEDLEQNSSGRLEVRTINFPMGFGAFGVDLDGPDGILFIEHYPFRTPGGSVPKFVLYARDGRWYEHFRQELLALWENGQPWTCNT